MPLLVDQDHADEVALEALFRVKARRKRMDDPRLQNWAKDPVAWVRERLGEFVWSKQCEVLESVRDHRRTAVPSAHETGKSFTAARAVCWWLDVHPPGEAFVVTTAPTAPQVRAILWREINRAHRKGQLAGHTNQTEWWLNDEIVAFGRKPAEYQPTAFQGIHARFVLVVIDEACGVPESLWRAAASLAANEHSRILAIGNPDDPSAYFGMTVCKPGSGWNVIPVDGLESPNFTDEPIPDELRDMLLSRVYEQELRDEVGEESPVYRSKIRGQFPEDANDGVVLLSWVRKCQRIEAEPGIPVGLGLDVGAGGDETVIRERRGMVAGRTWRKRTPNWEDSVALALEAIDACNPDYMNIDMIGVGWGTHGRLRELRSQGHFQTSIVGVNVGQGSRDPSKFPKLRDQIWWEVGRELSRTGGWDLAGVDEVTIAQLIAPKYHRDSANRIQVEPKAETKKRLRRSPDDADALLLAYYHGSSTGVWSL